MTGREVSHHYVGSPAAHATQVWEAGRCPGERARALPCARWCRGTARWWLGRMPLVDFAKTCGFCLRCGPAQSAPIRKTSDASRICRNSPHWHVICFGWSGSDA